MIYQYQKDSGFSATDAEVNDHGEFIADQLPEGEFGMYIFTEDGDVSAFTGLKVDFNGDLSMDFDMTHARKETDNGESLTMPIPPWTDEEMAQKSEEEIIAKMSEYIPQLIKWSERMKEQEKYQKTAAQNRAAAPMMIDPE